MLKKLIALAAACGLVAAAPALADVTHKECPVQPWSFSGPFGQYDQAQLQRGFKVYREVCAQCHSMNLVAFRNLGDPGGPFWSPKYPNSNDNPYVKAIAADYKVSDIDSDTGDNIKRAATSADYLPAPFPNEPAARASNGGALPPDMSLLVKAREGGPNYVYCIVGLGFREPMPASLTGTPPGKYYNPYFSGDLSAYRKKGDTDAPPPGGLISMPPPLTDGKVTFDDGSPSTIDQEARDVAAFLNWAADPKMEERKQIGLSVMVYLVLFSSLVYASYRRLWRNVEH
jgi:ubiquinol-cytochrome c reductase cytochrome c1 subunit